MKQINKVSVPSLLWTLFKAAVTIGLLYWLVVQIDWNEVIPALRAVPLAIVVLVGLLMFTSQAVASIRLFLLLNSQSIPTGYLETLRLNLIGMFASNFLPSTIGGDALKLALIANKGHSKTTTLAVLATDRLSSMATVLLFLPVVFTLHLNLKIDFTAWSSLLRWGGILVVIAVGGALILLATRKSLSKLKDHPLLGRIYHWAADVLTRFWASLKIWRNKPGVLLAAILVSFVSLLVGYAGGWILMSYGIGVKITLVEWIGASVLMYFLILLPISINGIGLQEAGFVFVLSQFKITPELSLTYALLLRVLQVLSSIPGGVLLWINNERKGV